MYKAADDVKKLMKYELKSVEIKTLVIVLFTTIIINFCLLVFKNKKQCKMKKTSKSDSACLFYAFIVIFSFLCGCVNERDTHLR